MANEASDSARHTALVTGSVAVGAYLAGALLRWTRRRRLRPPEALPPALDAPVHTHELMEGRARFYARPGSGPPLVFLPSFNAAASSFEMKPLFDHFARTTARPLYALDWFGFGLSDRPPVRYRPELYLRQLRRFLSEYLHEAADVVALSLGAAYAAVVAAEAPVLVRRLVLISPTGLTGAARSSVVRRALVGAAFKAGAFELLFSRLTQRETLARFYARQVFRNGAAVPADLVDYAVETTHVQGAPFAPRRFIDGSLFLGERAREAYVHLQRPALLLVPEDTAGLIQDFDGLGEVTARNAAFLTIHRFATGLMPHWEAPEPLFSLLDEFLRHDS